MSVLNEMSEPHSANQIDDIYQSMSRIIEIIANDNKEIKNQINCINEKIEFCEKNPIVYCDKCNVLERQIDILNKQISNLRSMILQVDLQRKKDITELDAVIDNLTHMMGHSSNI